MGLSLYYQQKHKQIQILMITAEVQIKAQSIKLDTAKKAKSQITRYLNSRNINHTGLSFCLSNGVSLYTTINGVKVRISDHGVKNFVRITEEAHINLSEIDNDLAWNKVFGKCGIDGFGRTVVRYDLKIQETSVANFNANCIVRDLGFLRLSKSGKEVRKYMVWRPIEGFAKI
jgi:hypothetical protein